MYYFTKNTLLFILTIYRFLNEAEYQDITTLKTSIYSLSIYILISE